MTFTDILDEYHVPYRRYTEHHHVSPGWISVDCVRCSPKSGHFRLGYNLTAGYSNCWQCGSVRTIDALVSLTGESYSRCWQLLKSLPTERLKLLPDRRGKLELPKGLGPLLPAHEKYLRERGFDPEELVRLWGVQGIGMAAEMAWRVFIPVVHHGDTVSWTARSIGEGGKRYLNARPEQEAVSQKKVLFGADYARHAVVVCEGPLDAIRIGPGAVATMGLICTAAQQNALGAFSKRVFCFDSEPAAQRRARSIILNLGAYPGENVNFLLDAKDAGEAKPREIRQLRKLLR